MKKVSKVSSKKKKPSPVDVGLGPAEIAKIRQANRQLWQRSSLARKLVVKRCLLPDGFSKCEQCLEVCAKVAVDHIEKEGAVEGGYLDRLWISSTQLQGLCKRCHDSKTKAERKQDKEDNKMNEAVLIPLDPDIEEMDIWIHEKVRLQEKRNAHKDDFSLDELLGRVIPAPAIGPLDDLF